MKRRLCIGGLLGVVLLVSQAFGTIRMVNLNESTIAPSNFTAKRGDTVRWTVVSGTHCLVSDSTSPKPWHSDTLSGTGTIFEYEIDSSGTYKYRCSLHPAVTYQFLVTTTCCLPPFRGDINLNGSMSIIDLNYLVDYFFGGGPVPPCSYEADVDGNGMLNILDMNAMIAYFFSGGPAPAPCP